MKPTPTKRTEQRYARALRNVARFSGQLVMQYVEGALLRDVPGLQRAVREYALSLVPWARRRAEEMVGAVDTSNARYWRAQSKSLRLELSESAVGAAARERVREQVALITSLPLQAAERAQALAQEAVTDGTRAAQVAEMLANTTGVTESRAVLIARTEVAKANAAINQARATSIGSDSYIWRTAGDDDVRESHQEVDGLQFRWDAPPDHSDGSGSYNPGNFPNCRCYAEPILPTRDY